MKINNIFRAIICILTFSCILSCSKDDEADGDFETKTFRVKEIISFDTYDNSEVYESKSILSYSNERLDAVINAENENGTWEENYKTELDYQVDWVVFNFYNKEGDMWVEDVEEEMRIKIVNGRIQKVEEFYDSDNVEIVYNYSGDKLTSVQTFYNSINELKLEFTYNGDNLQEVVEYSNQDGNWQAVMKFQFSYSEGKLMQIRNSYFNMESWQYSEKYEYVYSGDKLVKIDEYFWNVDNWDDFYASTYFEYNSEGLLESQSFSYSDGGYSYGQEFIYEEGKGNLKVFWNMMEGMYETNKYPSPQKSIGKIKALGTPYGMQFINKFPF